ncbi:hypothetical protein X731_24635 [Mesorhizobium sp. L2C054A000]|nr:hypothetical protein X731_24635 [Mesorhizobium sp. L2C054A000]
MIIAGLRSRTLLFHSLPGFAAMSKAQPKSGEDFVFQSSQPGSTVA